MFLFRLFLTSTCTAKGGWPQLCPGVAGAQPHHPDVASGMQPCPCADIQSMSESLGLAADPELQNTLQCLLIFVKTDSSSPKGEDRIWAITKPGSMAQTCLLSASHHCDPSGGHWCHRAEQARVGNGVTGRAGLCRDQHPLWRMRCCLSCSSCALVLPQDERLSRTRIGRKHFLSALSFLKLSVFYRCYGPSSSSRCLCWEFAHRCRSWHADPN